MFIPAEPISSTGTAAVSSPLLADYASGTFGVEQEEWAQPAFWLPGYRLPDVQLKTVCSEYEFNIVGQPSSYVGMLDETNEDADIQRKDGGNDVFFSRGGLGSASVHGPKGSNFSDSFQIRFDINFSDDVSFIAASIFLSS